VSKTVEYAEGPKATKNFEEGIRAPSHRLHVGANDIANPADFGVTIDFVDVSLLLAETILQSFDRDIESYFVAELKAVGDALRC